MLQRYNILAKPVHPLQVVDIFRMGNLISDICATVSGKSSMKNRLISGKSRTK